MGNRRKQGWKLAVFGLVCATLIVAIALRRTPFSGSAVVVQKMRGRATISSRLAEFGPAAKSRWRPFFEKSEVVYPPSKVVLVGLKREKQLQVYASDASGAMRLIRQLPILGSSGKLGPKLRYGDMQVPEGFYPVESLIPNSSFHLALRVGYPNQLDRSQAKKEGRSELGGDIMIHGSNVSIGCLAMGDEVAEDLFILGVEVGIENMRIIISPVDFRKVEAPQDENRPEWVKKLHREVKTALMALPEA